MSIICFPVVIDNCMVGLKDALSCPIVTPEGGLGIRKENRMLIDVFLGIACMPLDSKVRALTAVPWGLMKERL